MLKQSCKHAFIHRRANEWGPEIVEGNDGILALDEIGMSLSFVDIYARVGGHSLVVLLHWPHDLLQSSLHLYHI